MNDITYTLLNQNLPQWVRDNITVVCPYCNDFICDNHPTGTVTFRWCPNPYCPGHMQYKVEALAKHFKRDGFGVKSALYWCQTHPRRIHLEILKEWFDKKPRVPLSTVAKLAFIRGYGETSAVMELDSFPNFEAYFAQTSTPDPVLLRNKEYLLKCSTYFDIEAPMSKMKLVVMATGAFNGYSNRSDYFDKLNREFGNYIHVIETKGPRKTGVSCLIKEDNAPDRSKSRIAAECRIPVVTPKQFYEIIRSSCHT